MPKEQGQPPLGTEWSSGLKGLLTGRRSETRTTVFASWCLIPGWEPTFVLSEDFFLEALPPLNSYGMALSGLCSYLSRS